MLTMSENVELVHDYLLIRAEKQTNVVFFDPFDTQTGLDEEDLYG